MTKLVITTQHLVHGCHTAATVNTV